jgi:S1-C subfamily serine protease
MRHKNYTVRFLSLPTLLCILTSFLFTQGCLLATGVGLAVYASKKGDALVAEADAKQQKAYNEYRLGMEQINLEREKNKLTPRPILTMDEWLKWQAMPEQGRAEVIEKRSPKPEEYQTPAPSSVPSAAPTLYKPKETRKEKGISIGTGFFVSQDGYIITNYHVVEGTTQIVVVTYDNKKLIAKYIKGDPSNDIALLKVNTISKPLKLIPDTSLAKGEEVFTLGYPMIDIQGQEQKATSGRINALTGLQGDIRFVQIDVPLQPGNSGGPLINSKGNVVGIVTMTLDEVYVLKKKGKLPQNVNYAVKSDYIIPLIRYSMEDASKNGEISKDTKEITKLIKICEPSVVLIAAK